MGLLVRTSIFSKRQVRFSRRSLGHILGSRRVAYKRKRKERVPSRRYLLLHDDVIRVGGPR